MRLTGVFVVLTLGLTSHAFAWDPIGDITHPDRIIRNVGRETGNAVCDIPNVPRNIGREVGNLGQEINRLYLEGQANAAAPLLERWFIESRASALQGVTALIPPDVRADLSRYYDADVLNRVRFKIGDAGVMNLANLSIRYGDANAVTLTDLIVFANPLGPQDRALWAHELKHVQQFRDWGTRDFSIRYLRSWNSVENEAYAAQNNYRPTSTGYAPQPPYSPYPNVVGGSSAMCATTVGTCRMNAFGPIGGPCTCITPGGPFIGTIQ
jgi:hypothetical protein